MGLFFMVGRWGGMSAACRRDGRNRKVRAYISVTNTKKERKKTGSRVSFKLSKLGFSKILTQPNFTP